MTERMPTDPPGRDARLLDRVATAEEFHALAAAVGWLDHFHWPTIEESLAASVRGVVALDADGAAVGMARMLGDGRQYLMIHDVIVHPEHQGAGIAEALVERLLSRASEQAAAPIWVGLFASPEAEHVYEEAGFGSSDMRGMWREVGPR